MVFDFVTLIAGAARMELFRRTLLPALPLALLAFPLDHAAAESRIIQLPSVAQTAYYEGTLTMGGKNFRVRTRAPWIVCPDDCDIDFQVFDANGQLLGHAQTDSLDPTPPQAAAQALAPPLPAANVTPPPPTVDDEKDAEPASADVAETPPESPPPEPKHESEPEHNVPDVEPARGTPSLVTLTIGLGKEWLKAKGGVSDYEGAAGIGGTIVNAIVRPTASAVGFEAELAAHKYATSTKEEDIGSGSSSTQESKFLRLGARASAFYDFLEGSADGPSLGVGLGLQYIRMPALTISDASSGTADLKEQSAIGPVVTIIANTPTASHQFAALVEYLPLTLSKAWGATNTSATLSWRYAFVPQLVTTVDMHVQSVALKGKVDCPAVSACTDESSSKSTIAQARLGLGYRF